MQFSPDGTRLAIAGTVGIWLYDVSTGDEIALITEYKHKDDYSTPKIVFSPDGKVFANAGYPRTIWLWDSETGEQIRTIKIPNAPATSYQFFKDGTYKTNRIPLSKFNPDADRNSLMGFGPVDKKTKAVYVVPAGPLRSFSFQTDSKTLVTQNSNGTTWLWDITTGKLKATFNPKLPTNKFRNCKNIHPCYDNFHPPFIR